MFFSITHPVQINYKKFELNTFDIKIVTVDGMEYFKRVTEKAEPSIYNWDDRLTPYKTDIDHTYHNLKYSDKIKITHLENGSGLLFAVDREILINKTAIKEYHEPERVKDIETVVTHWSERLDGTYMFGLFPKYKWIKDESGQ